MPTATQTAAATRMPKRPRFFERGLLVLIALYVLTLPLVTHDLRAADEIEYFAYLRSVAFDRDLDFLNEYTYFFNRFPEKYSCTPAPGQTECKSFKGTFIDTVTATGKRPNFGPIGTAVLWSPFYLAGHLVAVGARAGGMDVAIDGYSKPYIWAVTFGTAAYALLGLLISYRLCRTLVSERAAFWGTLSIWLGTPVIFYSHLAPGYSHAASLFAVSLFLYLWMRWRDELTIPRAIAIGVVGGLIAMIREQDALFLLVPALYAGLGLFPLLRRGDWRGIVRSVVAVGTLGLASILTFVPQLITYQILNGEPRPNTDVSDKMNLVPPHFWDVMLDPAHALPYWSPIVVLAVIGLGLLTWRDPRLGLALLVGFVVTWYINGAINTWTTAGSFGARRFLNCTPLFVVGLAYAYEAIYARLPHPQSRVPGSMAWRAVVPALSILAIAWHGGLIVQFVTLMMDRQKLEWPRVLINQFRLPFELPGIVRRLLTDRNSFYQ